MVAVAVETSTATGSVALLKNGELLGEKTWTRDGSHSEFLTINFQQLLKEFSLDAKNIERIAVGVGPGSFTGVRVAVNFARALGYATGAKIFSMNSLEILAHQPAAQKSISVLQFAFRDLCYFAEFESASPAGASAKSSPRLKSVGEIVAVTAIELENILTSPKRVIGNGGPRLWSQFSDQLKANVILDTSARDFPLASDFLNTNFLTANSSLTGWNHVTPLYIRDSEAEEKLKRGLLKPS